MVLAITANSSERVRYPGRILLPASLLSPPLAGARAFSAGVLAAAVRRFLLKRRRGSSGGSSDDSGDGERRRQRPCADVPPWMPAQVWTGAGVLVVDAYGGVHECAAGAGGTLAPAELERLRAAQLEARRRKAVERTRCEAWWRERGAPGDPDRLAGIDA